VELNVGKLLGRMYNLLGNVLFVAATRGFSGKKPTEKTNQIDFVIGTH